VLPFPPEVRTLLWDVDPDAIDPVAHRDFILERVMSRGGWIAMQWLRRVTSPEIRSSFLKRKGERLSPRDRAYWRLVSGLPEQAQVPGGGRPPWLP